ncbi:ornithine cyclodeaminase family protein [Desulfosediminicola ganghwensis]|uniref:ornithine cyclodeaminase family protein n=1 Tax=Desulfosediminicola ganghwensis TaxID=2569540 RepID=UPI0010ABEF10|nr:ornithine cyclodeaminase [Desulfosediminicola ganghwensis]
MQGNTIRYFSGKDIRQILSMEKCIEAMKIAFSALSSDQAVVPVRSRLELEADNGNALFMPSYMPGLHRVGLKTVTNHKENSTKGLPIVHAMMMLFDSSNGEPLAIMDGEALTALRTGAGSGLATSYLARKDAKVVSIFGPGAQGEAQLEAVCAVRSIEQAYVFGRNQKKSEDFARKMAETLNISVLVADSMEYLEASDIVCTATPSSTPLFDDKHIRPGTHINAVGAYKTDMIEIPPATVARATVVVDQRAACLAEAGDIVQPIMSGLIAESHIHAELGQLANGTLPARQSEQEITFFKSVGVAVQDLVAADLLLKSALETGEGLELNL